MACAILLGFGAAVCLALAIWLFRPVKKKVFYDIPFDGLSAIFDLALNVLGEGSVVFIEKPNDVRFLQFVRYDHREDGPLLQFSFPRAPWSADYYDRVREALSSNGFAVDTEVTGSSDGVTAFLDVKRISSPAVAADIATLAWAAMGLSTEEHVRVVFLARKLGRMAWRNLRNLCREVRKASGEFGGNATGTGWGVRRIGD
jgi:hypothetical protein